MARKLNQLQLDELRKEKPSIPKKLVESLHEHIYALETSARYIFLGSMQVTQFFPKDSSKSKGLEDISFEDLVNRGAVAICQLSGIGKAKIEALIQVLETLLDGDETFSTPPVAQQAVPTRNVSYSPRLEQQSQYNRDVPILSSVESAKRIKEGVRQIKQLPEFSSFAQTKLQDFWDESIVSAPFIQDLTFAELCDLDVDVLLKKRSFSDRKIYALIQVLEEIVSHYGDKLEQKSSRTATLAQAPSIDPADIEWRDQDKLSPQFQHLLQLYSFELARVSEKVPEIANVLISIPTLLNAPQFVVYLLFADQEIESAKQIAQQIADTVENVVERVQSVLEPVFSDYLETMCSTWKMLLSAPAVSEDRMLASAEQFKGADGFLRSIARVCLITLGARRPSIQGMPFEGHWTLNPDAISFTLDSFLASLPIADVEFRAKLNSLFPLAEQRDLIQLLKPVVVFDSSAGQWVPLNG